MNLKQSVLIALCFIPWYSNADTITVFNDEDTDQYGALYYVGKNSYEQATAPVLIKKDDKTVIERPELKRSGLVQFFDRDLLISPKSEALKQTLSAEEYKNLPSINVGIKKGNQFFIGTKNGKTTLFNYPEYKIFNPFMAYMKTTLNTIKATLQPNLPQITQNPYKNTTASVRRGNELNNEERSHFAARRAKVKGALEKLLGEQLPGSYVPNIALIMSGGGFRALFYALGTFTAAEQIGLMDCVMWIPTLSGSTWALGPWMSSPLSMREFKKQFLKQVTVTPSTQFEISRQWEVFKLSSNDANLFMQPLLTKLLYNQPITIVDIFGSFLANRFFSNVGDKRQMVRLSEQAKIIAQGARPLPIYTAAQLDKKVTERVFQWYEFTPYEIGNESLGMYIPSWAFGRNFYQGKSTSNAPEQSFGYLLGIFGSAFAADAQKIFQVLVAKGVIKESYKPVLSYLEKAMDAVVKEKKYRKWQTPLSYAQIRNPFEGVGSIQENKFTGDEFVELVDAGLDFLLPYPPVSGQRPERKADILIFIDISDDLHGGIGLSESERFARKYNLKFPRIDYTNIDHKVISVFKDENDPTVPVVIYMPRINDLDLVNRLINEELVAPLWQDMRDQTAITLLKQALKSFNVEKCLREDVCSTLNFTYPFEKAELLGKVGEFNMLASAPEIIEAIRWKLHPKAG